ncbi:hypothetical protein [Streptomyces sp. NPDC054783]
MPTADFSRATVALELRPVGSATPEDVKSAVVSHVVSLMAHRHRAGNVTAVRLLNQRDQDRYLLLVSTDTGLTPDGIITDLASTATARNLGTFRPVTLPSLVGADPAPRAGGRDLGIDIEVLDLRPAAGNPAGAIVTAVDTHLAPLIGRPPTRAGNVLNISLLSKEGDDSQVLLLFGTDTGSTPFDETELDAVRAVATVTELGSFIQQPLSDEE